MEVRQAAPEDTARVMEIITLCRQQMQAAGSDQWDDIYPNMDVVREDAAAGCLYVLIENDAIIGAICMNEHQSPEYQTVAWRYAGRVLVLHRLCIVPERQGQGAARFLMAFAERHAAASGCESIRFDTYQGNLRAVALYEALGYQRAGVVSFPRRKLRFDCFERAILPQ